MRATPDQAQSRRNRGKTVRRSLVEASKAQDEALLARELRTSQTQQELAVLVVVEFTGELRKRKQISQAARLARSAAAVVAGDLGLRKSRQKMFPTPQLPPSTSMPAAQSLRNSPDQPVRR